MRYYFWAFGFALIWVLRSVVVTVWCLFALVVGGIALLGSLVWYCLIVLLGFAYLLLIWVAGELCFYFDLCIMVVGLMLLVWFGCCELPVDYYLRWLALAVA